MDQVRSRSRVAEHGEVLTGEREVSAMLDLVKGETQRIESRFLEPACGNGNFLAEVYLRKLAVVKHRYRKNRLEYERYAIIATSSIYGIELLEDNVHECQKRLLDIFVDQYTALYGDDVNVKCIKSVEYILQRNILRGDALTLKHPEDDSHIVFSEWSPVNHILMKRRDFVFSFLVNNTYQTTLFSDENNPASISKPIKDFPLVHYLDIWEGYE